MKISRRQREALNVVQRGKVSYHCSPCPLRRMYTMRYVAFGFASRTFEVLEKAGLIARAGKVDCQGGGDVGVVLTESGTALLAGEGM